MSALVTARPWLVLPIESNVRELHARTLLAAVAAERGLGVIIGRLADLPRYLPALPPSVLLQKDTINMHVDLVSRYGHVLTALDEEGLVYRDRDDYLRRRISVAGLERCERFFAWGDVHRAAVTSKAPHLAERIVAVGSPRIDLLRPELREIYQPEADALSRRYGRFVLVNTNLGTYNHEMGADQVVRHWAMKGWSDSEGGAELLQRTLEFQHRLVDEFVALMEALAAALPGSVGIVLRPHPSERHETWHSRLGHLDAVQVVHEGSVIPWLLATEAVVHNSCTSGIEAVLLDRPSFAYLPVRDEIVESVLPNDVSRPVESRAELVDAIVDVISGGDVGTGSPPGEMLSANIGRLAGPLASEAIVEHLEGVAPPASPLRHARAMPTRVRFSRAVFGVRWFASAALRRDLRGERDALAFYRRASPGVELADVNSLLGALSSATGRFGSVGCATLAPDLVVVGEPD